MVSTRPITKTQRSSPFEKGEKVLCYEPDLTKAKVLYDSKILGIYESRDKRGRKSLQYKVHFQGWSSSWDRKVSSDFVLKDTEENRQLQRDLAEKAQLQLGAYLYRKERSRKKRSRKSQFLHNPQGFDEVDTSSGGMNGGPYCTMSYGENQQSSPELRPRGLSEDNFSSGSTFEKTEELNSVNDEYDDTESCCSSIESFHDEERVLLRISERLRQYLEYDHDMIVKYGKQHSLPSRMPVVTILENFVKHTTTKQVFQTYTPPENTRRRSTLQRTDKKEREFDKLVANVSIMKEVVDGLRIYFDFIAPDYLFYKEERDYALSYLSEEYLSSFSYVPPSFRLSNDVFNSKCDLVESTTDAGSCSIGNYENIQKLSDVLGEEPQKRKLRSHRSDDCELLSSIASTSSGASTPLAAYTSMANSTYQLGGSSKAVSAMLLKLPPQVCSFMETLLLWRLLPPNAAAEPSMIFGAPHLARLLVKLPEFLNASTIVDEKLKVLLQNLETFVNYLESHREWFNEDNYARLPTTALKQTTTTPTATPTYPHTFKIKDNEIIEITST